MYNLTIAHHNIRGLNHKLTELKYFLQTNKPDIMTFNETNKIKPKTKIPGYKISKPKIHKGQGVAIIYKQNLNIDETEDIPTTENTDNLQHSIILNTPTDNIQISTLYCPRANPSTEIIDGLIQRHPKTILTGDFNSKHEDFGHAKSDKSGRTLVHITNKIHKYTKLNDNQPTYTNDSSQKRDVKDLIFSSPKMTKTFREFWVDEDLGSDHNIVMATFSHTNLLYKPPPKEIYLYHKADWDNINKNILNKMNTLNINEQSTCQELDNYIKTLTETINNNVEDNVRKIKIEPNKIGLPGHVIQLIEEKQKIRKLYQRTGIKQYKTQYNKLNKQIKQIIKEENKQNWEDKCNDIRIEDNHHKSWNQLKTLMGLKRQKTVIPTLITKINDKIHKSITDQEKVETITKSLKDIFTYEDNKPYFDEKHKIKIEKELNTTYKDKLEPLAIHFFFNKQLDFGSALAVA